MVQCKLGVRERSNRYIANTADRVAWVKPGAFDSRLSAAAWLVMIPAMASFVGMNFTGASTYTSLSGVYREMRVAVPIQAASAVVGVGLWIAGRFF